MTALEASASACGVAAREITSRSRLARIVAARHIAWFLFHDECKNFSKTGRAFRVKHHTVMHAVHKIEDSHVFDPPLASLFLRAKALMRSGVKNSLLKPHSASCFHPD